MVELSPLEGAVRKGLAQSGSVRARNRTRGWGAAHDLFLYPDPHGSVREVVSRNICPGSTFLRAPTLTVSPLSVFPQASRGRVFVCLCVFVSAELHLASLGTEKDLRGCVCPLPVVEQGTGPKGVHSWDVWYIIVGCLNVWNSGWMSRWVGGWLGGLRANQCRDS